MPDTVLAEPREKTDKEIDLLEKYLEQLHDDSDNSEDQRDKANEDMRFIHVTGGQWEGFLEDDFEDRVKLQFDITTPYKNRFIGEWNQNRVEVDYKPDDEATTNDDADLLNGVRKADFKNNAGKLATDNAVDEVATCGYGCFKLATEFEDEGDPENEKQKIVFRPIHNAYHSVIWDSSSKWIDKRDARWVNELTSFTPDAFKEAYPDFEPVSAFEPEDRAWLNPHSESNHDFVFIATRYERIKSVEKVFIYKILDADPKAGEKLIEVWDEKDHELIKDELKENEFREFVRERKVKRWHVEKTVFSGEDILEKSKRIAGRFLPIIAIYGYRGWVDGVEWYKGLVRPLKDAQRMFNMQISQLAENSTSSGQEKPIFTPEQMLGDIGKLWADVNNKPYLLANAILDAEGNPIHTGPIGYLKPAQLDQATAELMRIVPAYIQQVTGGAPQDTLDPDASGKAINALLKRENLNTQDISDNIVNSFVWSGVVYESMVQDVYTSKRMIRTIGKDGADAQKFLRKVVQDSQTGKLVESNNLSGKKFRVDSDIGPQTDTLREQTVEQLKGMLDALKETEAGAKYTPAVIAMILSNIRGSGLEPLQKMVRQDMILQGLQKPETDEEIAFVQAQQQPKDDPQAELVKAAALQAEGEAKERASKVADNLASAQKKQAEIEKIISDIKINEAKALAGLKNDKVDMVEKLIQEINSKLEKNELDNAKQVKELSQALSAKKKEFQVVRGEDGKVESLVAG